MGEQSDITNMFKRMESEVNTIVRSVVELVYFMRGAIQYDDMMFRTAGERALMQEFITERMNQEKDHMHPQY